MKKGHRDESFTEIHADCDYCQPWASLLLCTGQSDVTAVQDARVGCDSGAGGMHRMYRLQCFTFFTPQCFQADTGVWCVLYVLCVCVCVCVCVCLQCRRFIRYAETLCVSELVSSFPSLGC